MARVHSFSDIVVASASEDPFSTVWVSRLRVNFHSPHPVDNRMLKIRKVLPKAAGTMFLISVERIREGSMRNLRHGWAVAVLCAATVVSACTSSDSSLTTGSVGYGAHSADYSLRPACASGFGNDRPCSY